MKAAVKEFLKNQYQDAVIIFIGFKQICFWCNNTEKKMSLLYFSENDSNKRDYEGLRVFLK